MLHIEGCDVDKLGRATGGEGGELVSWQRDGVEVVEGSEEALGQGRNAIVFYIELLQEDRVGQWLWYWIWF